MGSSQQDFDDETTPAVPVRAVAVDDPQMRIETPSLVPAVHLRGTDAELEQQFFVAAPLITAQPVDAAPVEDAVVAPVASSAAPRTRAGWLVLLGVIAVGVSLVVERVMLREDAEAVAAPVPVLVAPRKVAPIVVAEPVAPPVDAEKVQQLIAEGRKAYDEGRTKDALVALESALDMDPSDVPAWLLLALARYDSGNDPGAWEAVTMVQQLEPNNPRAYLLKATMELQAKLPDQARQSVARYLELDPQGQFADEARALVQRLH
jgi:tetratricopeptide (TPR) repeat protein